MAEDLPINNKYPVTVTRTSTIGGLLKDQVCNCTGCAITDGEALAFNEKKIHEKVLIKARTGHPLLQSYFYNFNSNHQDFFHFTQNSTLCNGTPCTLYNMQKFIEI